MSDVRDWNFSVLSEKGFRLTFDNGITLSTVFGYGNYCNNREICDWREEYLFKILVCENCEIAIIKDGEFITKEILGITDDDVLGYVDIKKRVEILNICVNYKEEK